MGVVATRSAAQAAANVKCDAPVIKLGNFYQHVTMLVGSSRNFSSIIHSDIPLKEGYPKWTKLEPFPDHVICNTECPTLSNTTCSNLTLIDVSQSGYYTIIAENECGSDNFTVYVEVAKIGKYIHAHSIVSMEIRVYTFNKIRPKNQSSYNRPSSSK